MIIKKFDEYLKEYNIFNTNEEYIRDIYLDSNFISNNILNGIDCDYKWCGTIKIKFNIIKNNNKFKVEYDRNDISKNLYYNNLNDYYKDAFNSNGEIKKTTKLINIFQDRINDNGKKIYKQDDDGNYIISNYTHRDSCYGILLKVQPKENNNLNIKYVFLLSLYKNAIEKIYKVNDVSATDWEMILVCSWYFSNELYNNNQLEYYKYVSDKSNVPIENVKLYDFKNGDEKSLKYESIVKKSDNMIMRLKEHLGISQDNMTYNMKYVGNNTYDVTNDWLKYNNNKLKQPPKTDIIIYNTKTNDIVYKISLKKKGGSQLFSGGYTETESIFINVMNNDTYNDMLFYEIDNFLNCFKEIRDIIGIDDTVTNILKDETNVNYKIVSFINEKNKELTQQLNNIFKNEHFKNLIIKESLCGELKFGKDSDATADTIMIFDETTQEIEIYNINDQDFIKQISNYVNFNISFKSSDMKTRSVVRFIEDIKNIIIQKNSPHIVENITEWKEKYDDIKKFLNMVKSYLFSIIKKGVKLFLNKWGIKYNIEIKKNYNF